VGREDWRRRERHRRYIVDRRLYSVAVPPSPNSRAAAAAYAEIYSPIYYAGVMPAQTARERRETYFPVQHSTTRLVGPCVALFPRWREETDAAVSRYTHPCARDPVSVSIYCGAFCRRASAGKFAICSPLYLSC